jgi:hypothetical protein
MRSLAFLIVGFALTVVLPNEIGTEDLPAVGGKKIATSADGRAFEPARPGCTANLVTERRPALHFSACTTTWHSGVMHAAPGLLSSRLRV